MGSRIRTTVAVRLPPVDRPHDELVLPSPRLLPVTAAPKARARFRWNRSRVFYYIASTINLVVQWSSCAVLRHTRWVACPWVCDRPSAYRPTAHSQSTPEQNLNPTRIVNRRIFDSENFRVKGNNPPLTWGFKLR